MSGGGGAYGKTATPRPFPGFFFFASAASVPWSVLKEQLPPAAVSRPERQRPSERGGGISTGVA
ncbi:hypothetical protein HW82_26305 [Salmonella enterica]|nr:hypothetical protein [Salmonella enterica]